jgi:hypothetical protein
MVTMDTNQTCSRRGTGDPILGNTSPHLGDLITLTPLYQRRTDNGSMDRFSVANRCSRGSIGLFAFLTGAEIGKEGSEDAECGKQRADVVHEVNTGVIGKLAEKRGADAA